MAHICITLAFVAVLLMSQEVSAKQNHPTSKSLPDLSVWDLFHKKSRRLRRDHVYDKISELKYDDQIGMINTLNSNELERYLQTLTSTLLDKPVAFDEEILTAPNTSKKKKKRGCSAFGHSCWGGHGKRSLDSSGTELEIGGRLGQEETPPHPGYPNSGYGLLPYGDDMIPVRNGGAFDHDENAREQLKFKLRNIVKHWMENYRRQQNDDAYVLENM